MGNNNYYKVKKEMDKSFIRRYSNVAYELPKGAQEVLTSRMGSIEVTAKDSFERHLMENHVVSPKYDYITFQKNFAEIFVRKALFTLKKIKENRDQGNEYYISNNYFGKEFDHLFIRQSESKSAKEKFISKIERGFWIGGNRFLKGLINLGESVNRFGLKGLCNFKLATGLLNRAKEIKWR